MSLPLSPSYTGFIGSTKDAVLVIQAVLRGDLPLVDHRPQDRERAELIKSGNVFVFVEESSGIKRWTDGISWSASRILGRFLVYRELDPTTINEKDDKRKRRKHLELWPLRRLTISDYMSEPALLADYRRSLLDYRAFDPNVPDYVALNAMNTGITPNPGINPVQPAVSSSLPSAGVNAPPAALNAYGRRLVSRDKPSQVVEDHGLIKKTLSVSTVSRDPAMSKDNKQTIHLISYYSAHDVLLGKLTRPSHGSLKNLEVPSLLWDAVKKSSLGGKIPIEDEAYYFLDSNYQLQNMSVLLNTRADAPKNLPLPSHQQVAKPLQSNPSKLPYVLPVPFSGPAPPLTFHVDYGPPLFLLQAKPPSLNPMEPMKKEEEHGDLASVSSYSAPTSMQTFSHSSNYSFPEQRSPEVLVLLFASSQPSQHPLYDQLLHHHHPQYSHLPQQAYPLPGPSGSLDHQYLTQEGVYVPGYSGQYPGVSYQMYNSAGYFNPGSEQIMQPPNTNAPPGENASSLKSQQVQYLPQQFLQSSLTNPQTRPQQQAQQHLLQPFDFNTGQRAGYFGGVTPLNPSGHGRNPSGHVRDPSARKRAVEYPEYFAPTEEPYNYN